MTTDTSSPKLREKTKPDTDFLKDIAIYLTGYERGKGDILPLGRYHIETLWEAIKFIKNAEKQ